MKFITESDYYQVQLATLVSDVDKQVIIRLYQPLIGALATILYFNLLDETKAEDDYVFNMADLILKMQISLHMLEIAKKALEGVGLLKSYYKDSPTGRYFIFELFSPKAPKDFFNDTLFRGLLIQYIGEYNVRRLASEYRLNDVVSDDYTDQSATFLEVFNPDLDDQSFLKAFMNKVVGRKVGKINTEFDPAKFFETIHNESQISDDAFTEADLKEIERLATLFGFNETFIAKLVISLFKPEKEVHLDYAELGKACRESLIFPKAVVRSGRKYRVSSQSTLANKVKLLECCTPAEYLRILQHNTKPSVKDLKLIDKLSQNYGLTNGVMNVIIDYVLVCKGENVLSYNYCEAIATSLVREGVKNAVDAMDVLTNKSIKMANRIEKNRNKKEEAIDEKVKENKEETSISNEEMRKKIEELTKGK